MIFLWTTCSRSSLLSLEAFRLFDSPRTRSLLMDNLVYQQNSKLLLKHDFTVDGSYAPGQIAFSSNGKAIALLDASSETTAILDIETGKPIGCYCRVAVIRLRSVQMARSSPQVVLTESFMGDRNISAFRSAARWGRIFSFQSGMAISSLQEVLTPSSSGM